MGRSTGAEFSIWAADQGLAMAYVIHDRNTKFTALFDAILESEGAKASRMNKLPSFND